MLAGSARVGEHWAGVRSMHCRIRRARVTLYCRRARRTSEQTKSAGTIGGRREVGGVWADVDGTGQKLGCRRGRSRRAWSCLERRIASGRRALRRGANGGFQAYVKEADTW